MPLFFGSSNNGVKPQQLSNRNAGGPTADLKDSRGTVVKLQKNTVVIEKKLAEGGFAIIYLVSDKNNRQYALKRQFISDDVRQLEACKRECCIVSCLQGHKNIVRYVDHLISKNRYGVYEYLLLTVYYKNSVLQLMNERLMSGRCLSAKEILAIFCDMCEAVARLHHSQTPVIHRDLKVENILIDDSNRSAPPKYVLCDFGSATTKVLSLETHSRQFLEEEILRYTTLSYRAPEMIDIYAGRPIGTKSDIWAMGVLLYKLCYFSLPFGESSLAIQNCSYVFPNEPEYPDELRAIIKVLLQPDIDKRPDIYQVCCFAFEAAGKNSPVGNLNKVRRIPLSEALEALRNDNVSNLSTTRYQPAKSVEESVAGCSKRELVTNEITFSSGVSTSVNPRSRPKPSANSSRNNKIFNVVGTKLQQQVPVSSASAQVLQGQIARQNSMSSPDIGSAFNNVATHRGGAAHSHTSTHSSSFADALSLGFKDLEDNQVKQETQRYGPTESLCDKDPRPIADVDIFPNAMIRDVMSMHLSAPQLFPDNNRSNTFPVASNVKPNIVGGFLKSSAFKPYSETTVKHSVSSNRTLNSEKNSLTEDFIHDEDMSFELVASTSKWNPFTGAPFDGAAKRDLIKAYDKQGSADSLSSTVDEADPFGAAPFDDVSQNSRYGSLDLIDQQKPDSCFVSVGNDETDTAKIMTREFEKQKLHTADYDHFCEGIQPSHLRTESLQRDQLNKKATKQIMENDWYSDGSKSDSASEKDADVHVPSSNGNSATEEMISSSAFPALSASSSTAPLLSCSTFSLKSAVAPSAAITNDVAVKSYETQFTGEFVAGEPNILYENNPFANMEVSQQQGKSNPLLIPFSVPSPNFPYLPTSTRYTNVLVDEPSQPHEQQKCASSFDASQACVSQIVTANKAVADPSTVKPDYKLSPSKRCRILSTGSSHSSDDSPQIDEGGDKMLLKDVRSKSSHSGNGGSRRKKLGHMEQFAASRAYCNQNLPSVDGGGSVKHSPAPKKHSRKHSGPPAFKRSAPGALDASSFVNTSFQAEDWETRPISPLRSALPQHT